MLTCSFKTEMDFRHFARLVSKEAILFLSWLKPSTVLGRLGAGGGWEDGMSSSFSESDLVRLAGDWMGEIGGGAWLSLISASMATTVSSFAMAIVEF